MSGTPVFHRALPGVETHHQQSDKLCSSRNILGETAIDMVEKRGEIRRRFREGSHIGASSRHQQRGSKSVASDIAYYDVGTSPRLRNEIEIIATGLVAWESDAGHVKP